MMMKGITASGKRMIYDIPIMLETSGIENTKANRELMVSSIREITEKRFPDLEITIYTGEEHGN